MATKTSFVPFRVAVLFRLQGINASLSSLHSVKWLDEGRSIMGRILVAGFVVVFISGCADVVKSGKEQSKAKYLKISAGRQRQEESAYLQLCHPLGQYLAGFEGLPPQGTELDKVYFLILAARGISHRHHLQGFTKPPVSCHTFPFDSRLQSLKVQTYPQAVQDFKLLHKSKAGLNIFDLLPLSGDCSVSHVSPFGLVSMIKLGEYLTRKYGQLLSALHDAGKDTTVASCQSDQAHFQSTIALLHGLLNEKQFMRVNVKKLQRHVVRGVGSHNWCQAIEQIDIFMQDAYTKEHEIFGNGDDKFTQHQKLYQNLGLHNVQSAKDIIQNLSHWFCETGSIPCSKDSCMHLTETNISEIIQVISKHNAYLSSNSFFKSYAVADAFMYIENLFSWFTGNQFLGQSMKVDSVDDFFFLKLLVALGYLAEDPLLPGSRLVIEQYQKKRPRGSAKFWRILLNGKIITEQLNPCSLTASKGLCGLDTIKAYFSQLALNNTFGICMHSRDEL